MWKVAGLRLLHTPTHLRTASGAMMLFTKKPLLKPSIMFGGLRRGRTGLQEFVQSAESDGAPACMYFVHFATCKSNTPALSGGILFHLIVILCNFENFPDPYHTKTSYVPIFPQVYNDPNSHSRNSYYEDNQCILAQNNQNVSFHRRSQNYISL